MLNVLFLTFVFVSIHDSLMATKASTWLTLTTQHKCLVFGA